jgi:hypothetical protein
MMGWEDKRGKWEVFEVRIRLLLFVAVYGEPVLFKMAFAVLCGYWRAVQRVCAWLLIVNAYDDLSMDWAFAKTRGGGETSVLSVQGKL